MLICLSHHIYLEINQNDRFFLFFSFSFFFFRYWCLRLEFRNVIFYWFWGFAFIMSFIPVYYLHQHLVIF